LHRYTLKYFFTGSNYRHVTIIILWIFIFIYIHVNQRSAMYLTRRESIHHSVPALSSSSNSIVHTKRFVLHTLNLIICTVYYYIKVSLIIYVDCSNRTWSDHIYYTVPLTEVRTLSLTIEIEHTDQSPTSFLRILISVDRYRTFFIFSISKGNGEDLIRHFNYIRSSFFIIWIFNMAKLMLSEFVKITENGKFVVKVILCY